MKVRSWAEFTSDLPEDHIEDGGEIVQFGGKSVAAAIAEMLTRCGCKVSGPFYGHESGWGLDITVGKRQLWAQIMLIDGYLFVLEQNSWFANAFERYRPEYLDVLEHLRAELAADPRFHNVRWLTSDELQGGTGADDGPSTQLLAKPWARLWARLFDVAFASLVITLVLGLAVVFQLPWTTDLSTTPESSAVIGFLILPLALGLDALIMTIFGNTIGKRLVGIRVVGPLDSKLSLVGALWRNAYVYLFGLALGIPVLNLFTLAHSRSRLAGRRQTLWDESMGTRVIARGGSARRTMITAIGVLILWALGRAAIFAPASFRP